MLFAPNVTLRPLPEHPDEPASVTPQSVSLIHHQHYPVPSELTVITNIAAISRDGTHVVDTSHLSPGMIVQYNGSSLVPFTPIATQAAVVTPAALTLDCQSGCSVVDVLPVSQQRQHQDGAAFSPVKDSGVVKAGLECVSGISACGVHSQRLTAHSLSVHHTVDSSIMSTVRCHPQPPPFRRPSLSLATTVQSSCVSPRPLPVPAGAHTVSPQPHIMPRKSIPTAVVAVSPIDIPAVVFPTSRPAVNEIATQTSARRASLSIAGTGDLAIVATPTLVSTLLFPPVAVEGGVGDDATPPHPLFHRTATSDQQFYATPRLDEGVSDADNTLNDTVASGEAPESQTRPVRHIKSLPIRE